MEDDGGTSSEFVLRLFSVLWGSVLQYDVGVVNGRRNCKLECEGDEVL